jgi:hypothetical protein
MSDDTTTEPEAPAPESAPEDAERVVYPITEHKPVPAIFGAICEVMNAIGAIGKDKRSDHGNFKFRGIDDVMNVVGPVMRAHCMFVSPRLVSIERHRYESKGGGSLMNTIVQVEFVFTSGADGSEHVVGPIPGEGMDTGDKSTAKAMSVALRTALLEVFMIPTEDRDPDHDVYEVATPAPSAPTAQRGGGRVRASRPTPKDQDADPWADDNPERVKYYADAIAASGNDGSLRLVWEEVAAECEDGKLSNKDGNHLSNLVKRRRADLAKAAAAAPVDPEAPFHTA